MTFNQEVTVIPVENTQAVNAGGQEGQKGKGKKIFNDRPETGNQHCTKNEQDVNGHGQGEWNGHESYFIVAFEQLAIGSCFFENAVLPDIPCQ